MQEQLNRGFKAVDKKTRNEIKGESEEK